MPVTIPFDIQPILSDEKILLRPVRDEDFEELYAVASDPAIWEMHPYRDRYKREVFEVFWADALTSGGCFVVIDKTRGQIVGSTRFANYSAADSEIEIGWTFLACAYWRGGFNRAVKALMLKHIFQYVDTVTFQIGSENYRSRTAVERIGAKPRREYQRDYYGQIHDYVEYKLSSHDAAAGALADVLA